MVALRGLEKSKESLNAVMDMVKDDDGGNLALVEGSRKDSINIKKYF